MKEKLHTKQGISLIVLVITIIVIIILAVAVILTLANNNPIENAKFAVEKNDEAVRKEAATLAYADWYLQENSNNKSGKSAQKYVEDALKSQGIDTTGLIVSNNGTIVTNAPTIPNGFKYLTGTVEEGFVIKNTTDDNEFVWVPVEKGSFKREGFGTDLSDYSELYEEEGYTSEREEYDAMVASVSKYGGFYMGRYEASNNGSDKAQSLPNKTPWNYIAWGDGMTEIGTTGAVAKARAVYPDSNEKTTGDAVSTLPYGVQWDATVRWIRDSKEEYKNITSDSSIFGNYSSEGIIPTGSNPSYALNNIYDIAGNVAEWTMETYFSVRRVSRGGTYPATGSINPVSDRYDEGPDYDYVDIGFRLALYIK